MRPRTENTDDERRIARRCGVFRVLSPLLVPFRFENVETAFSEDGVGAPPHWVTLVLVALATYRLTRFVTRDAFPLIAVPRAWLQARWDPMDDTGWASWYELSRDGRDKVAAGLRERGIPRPNVVRRSVAYLVTCAWCVSIWVGAGVAVAAVLAPPYALTWSWSPFAWLAASAITGLISQREPD